MDRTPTNRLHRLGLVVALLLLVPIGPGCSRMRTYRSQNSPLPGLPLLGRARRGALEAPSAVARGPQVRNRGNVAWSGQPNTSPPIARLDPPPGLSDGPVIPGPQLAKADASTSIVSEPTPRAIDPAIAKVRGLVQEGRANLGKIQTYQVGMTRQERVGGSLLPREEVLLSVRRDPKAVRLEWPSGSHKGREVLYSASEPGGMMHINMADSILPMPRMSMSPDSPLVMKNSRHPITEAGLDAILDQLDATLKPHEAGVADGERLSYDGRITPPEIGRPCHKVTRVTTKRDTWVIYLDAATTLPVFVEEMAANGALMERYTFTNFVADPPTLADASAFDPDRRWGTPRTLFGRLAQAGTANPTPK